MTQAFILGAGLGTRLQPLTHHLPKPLIPVFNRPLAQFSLDHCLRSGLSDFAINTHHLPDEWQAAFPDQTYAEAPLSFFFEKDILETGGGLKNIENFLKGEPLLIYNGDILTNIDLDALISHHKASGNVATLALRSSGANTNIALQDEKVIDLRHARGIHPGTHQFTGIYIVQPEMLDLIPAGEKISVVPAFLELAEAGKLGGLVLDDGYWLDLGERESYLDVHQMEGIGQRIHPDATISPDATVERSTVGPGCVIEAGAVVKDSVLWANTHILSAAHLRRCIVYSSTPVTGSHENADL